MSRIVILSAVLALAVLAAGLFGSTRNTQEGFAITAFSKSNAIVVAGEWPWQGRGQ